MCLGWFRSPCFPSPKETSGMLLNANSSALLQPKRPERCLLRDRPQSLAGGTPGCAPRAPSPFNCGGGGVGSANRRARLARIACVCTRCPPCSSPAGLARPQAQPRNILSAYWMHMLRARCLPCNLASRASHALDTSWTHPRHIPDTCAAHALPALQPCQSASARPRHILDTS